ncbi:MAG: FliH/SctL family protein [Tepidisphaeraceae bacterium]|jgi:flagellar assembly protein FliH
MGLIKSADVPMSVSVFSMRDIEAAAKSVILRARAKAGQIIAAAQTESEKIHHCAKTDGLAEGRRQGQEQGFEEGKKAGHAEALAEHGAAMTQLIGALTQAVRLLDDGRDQLQTHGINEVVRLACAIARKVTKRQGIIDEQTLSRNLSEALSLAIHAADVRVAVHPSQLKTLQAELPNLRLAWPQLKHVELTEDSSIAPGGARVFTAHGKIDGDLDSQLDQIIGELLPEQPGEAK